MRNTRVIPQLLLSSNGLVKTSQFSRPQYIGDPINAVRIFSDLCSDELSIIDVCASFKRSIQWELLERISSESLVPISYGGGITCSHEARKVCSLGYEKVVVNSASLSHPEVLNDISSEIGSQSLVATIDYTLDDYNVPHVYNYIKKTLSPYDISTLVSDYSSHGVGELVLQCVTREGMQCGLDFQTALSIKNNTTVPITLSGGCNSIQDIQIAASFGFSVLCGSLFVYKSRTNGVLLNYPNNLDEILS